MKHKRLGQPRFNPIYCNEGEGGEGGGGGGGNGGEESTSFTQDQLDAAVEKAVGGLKSKNSEVMGKLKEAQSQLKSWEGLDPESVRTMLDNFEKDEVLKLHAEGKHDEAYSKRTETDKAKWQSQLDGVVNERNDIQSQLEKSQEQVRDLIIDQQVLGAFIQEKGLEQAAPDVVLRAKNAFDIEDGIPIARDADGEIIRGKEGPITIQEWIQARKADCPHWFPASQGAGAGGGDGAQGGGTNLEQQMEQAAAAGDMKLYRKLREQRDKVSGAA
jgi:hypothetical protein